MSYRLPDGWTFAKPEELALDEKYSLAIGPFGSNLKVKDYRDSGVPLIFVRDIRAESFGGDGTRFVEPEKANELQAHAARPGDLLMTKMGDPPGDTAIYPETRPAGIITADCIKLTPNPSTTSSEFLKYLFRAEPAKSQILENTRGVAQQKLSLKRFKSIDVPLPPLNEQRRIVAKIEELERRSRNAKQALDAIPPLLERFRQSVLAAAFRGDLTKQWRQQNPNTEPASELLKRIRQERRHRWEQDYLEKQKAKGKQPKNDKWKEKYKEPESVDTTDLPDLPEGWCWAILEDVAGAVDPQPSHRTPPAVDGGVPYIGMGDIASDSTVDFENARKVSPSVLDEHRARYTLRRGDFIFGKIGTIGAPVEIPEPFDYCLSANVILLQPTRWVNPRWLLHYLRSPQVKAILSVSSRATTQAAFGIKKMRRLAVPVPSRLEQDTAVEAVDAALEKIALACSGQSQSCNKLARLDQSILAKAFRGELVPQDPNDEPAIALLARVENKRPKSMRGAS